MKILGDYFWGEKLDRVQFDGNITTNLHNSLVFELFFNMYKNF